MFVVDGWHYTCGALQGRSQPALYRTRTGSPLEVLGYFTSGDTMQTFIDGVTDALREQAESFLSVEVAELDAPVKPARRVPVTKTKSKLSTK